MMNRKKSTGADWQGQEIKLHVVFEKEGDNNWPISVKVLVHANEEKEIHLGEVIWRLKEQSLNDYYNSSVSYFHQNRQLYIFGFLLPLPELSLLDLQTQKYAKRIPEQALSTSASHEPSLKLRFRKRVPSRLELLKEEQKMKYVDNEGGEGKQTKQKEKTIQEVVEKVALWRKLYTGFLDEGGEVVHLDLQSSANEIGIVKKTLDDYLLQIRNGKRYGFNFHKRRTEKIGELRSFVKERKLEDNRGGRK